MRHDYPEESQKKEAKPRKEMEKAEKKAGWKGDSDWWAQMKPW